jgi:DNA-binding NtrC family response regulator
MNEALFSRVLEIVLEEVPARRSLVLVPGAGGARRARVSGGIDWDAGPDVSREVVAKVLESGQPLLASDLGADPGFPARGGAPGRMPVSALCLPLLAGGTGSGAIYLDRSAGDVPFTAADLEFLAAAAGFLNHILAGAAGGDGAGDGGNGRGGPAPIVGRDGAFGKVRALIEKVRNTDAPVFISGESGTGKELVARTIHETGPRKNGQFVAVNCGAIPDSLLESELFGYARGSFTGAARDKTGLIEEADRGTFFLDEIGDLTLHLQAKLLRALEERSIRRLGETRPRAVDVRFVSATNKNLEKEVREGRFREDLYYRLKIIVIELPPLRERREDLVPLLNHFAERYAREMRRPQPYFSPPALEMLLRYAWPGNVRELQNEVRRCLVLASDGNLIREEHLSPAINPRGESFPESSLRFAAARADFEKRFLLEALARCDFRRTRTAAEIGITRQGLFKLIRKHRIETPRKTGNGGGVAGKPGPGGNEVSPGLGRVGSWPR